MQRVSARSIPRGASRFFRQLRARPPCRGSSSGFSRAIRAVGRTSALRSERILSPSAVSGEGDKHRECVLRTRDRSCPPADGREFQRQSELLSFLHNVGGPDVTTGSFLRVVAFCIADSLEQTSFQALSIT